MSKQKISGPALFMYAVIFVSILCAAVCFSLYYGNKTDRDAVLWAGIVAFMLVYHLWGRILMGTVSKRFPLKYTHPFFRERAFEKRFYGFLQVKKWKGSALTYDPSAFSLEVHSFDEIAYNMTKAETDHWMNALISLGSLLFSLLWGEAWIFAITAFLAMLFDAQFILIQRFNRPRVLRILEKQKNLQKRVTEAAPLLS